MRCHATERRTEFGNEKSEGDSAMKKLQKWKIHLDTEETKGKEGVT